ncbi:spermatogenesis-associated protein 31D1-like [Molossus molossus]|uniref:SPATA31 subfamily D member 1 n=1 Tax=Molossus molossus TaxID=27622 RepID=A0A7J8EGL2_MOLMO|nr:spermatogenesis-associated protein 31D1-like [Molossus molossus]KAF6434530.1 SPATA31 subfamily D member 1 [Molossus molossus]
MAELQLHFLIIPILIFLCGVGLLLSLCHKKKKPSFPVFLKQGDIGQYQSKAKRQRNSGAQTGWKACQREVEEAKNVLSLLQSPLGQHHDTIHLRQLLCPDPSCEVCNHAAAEVNRLLFPEALEDASPLAPTTPGLSQSTNATDSFACQHISPMLSTSPPSDCPAVIQSKSIFTSLKPVPEDTSPDSSSVLSTHVPTIRDTDHSSLSISDISCWQDYASNMFLPTLSHSDFQQEHVFLHLPETCLWGDSVSKHMETSSLSFLGLNIQALLERQVKKTKDFQILEKKENEDRPFSKQIWSEYQQTSLGNSLQPLDVQDTTVLQTGWNIEDKPEQLHNSQQLFYVKTLVGNLQQKYNQLFWGLPSLHSESLVATLLGSRISSSLETHFVLFNGICNAPIVKMQHQGSPSVSHFHFLPLFNVDPKHLLPIKSQSQHFAQVQPQLHFQSRLPILPSSSPSQIRDCGVSFPGSQNTSDSNILNESQHMKCHVLQKQQESLCSLPTVVQRSQHATCPRALNRPLSSQSSHAYLPVSILPGHFHTTSEPQEKQQHYIPRRVIPLGCPHARRNVGLLQLMASQSKLTETSQQKGRQLSELQRQCSKSLGKSELSLSGHVCERVPQNFQLREDMKRNLGYILEKSPEDSPQRLSECHLGKVLRAASETKINCVGHSMSCLEKELLNISRKDINRNKIKNILRLHLRRKSWQITEGRIPIVVCDSWVAEDNTPPPFGSSQTNKENTNSKNTVVGRVYSQITTPELSFLDSHTRQVLEGHIIRFRLSQRWGLPLKVVEYMKFYTLKEAKTWRLPQFDLSSSATSISGVVSKAEVFKPLERSSKTFQRNKLRTINLVPMLDCPLLASSNVNSEGQGVLKTSHADMEDELAENIQKTVCGRQTFQQPLTHSTTDKWNQSDTVLNNRCSPEVPRKQPGAGHKPRYENVSSSVRAEVIEGKKTAEENLKHFPVSKMFTEIFKDQELGTIKSQPCDISTTQELGGSQMMNVNMRKEAFPLTTECPSPKMLETQDSKLSNLKRQVLDELKLKMESKEQSQAQSCSTNLSLASDSFSSISSQAPFQNISVRDMRASKGALVHLADSRISTELRPEAWVSKNVLWKCQDNSLPPVARKVRTVSSKTGQCRSEELAVETSEGRKKSHYVEDRKLQGTFLSLPQNEEFPRDSYFRKKTRKFYHWMDSKGKIKELEHPQQKAKFMPAFAKEHDPAESAAVFLSCGYPEAHELMTAIGKILQGKMASSHELESLQFSQQK